MYKVLIVDDDKLERNGLICTVPWESIGMAVVGDVSNGSLALDFLKDHEVDLAVVDITMPVLSGLDFIKESRKRQPGLAYVVLSFHEDFEYVQQALRLGALDYISKLRLEEEDCTEIFRKISALIGVSREQMVCDGNRGLPEDAEQGLAEPEMEKLRVLWCGMRWVYDKERFQEQLDALGASGIGLRQMERLLIWVSRKADESFGIGCNPPYLSSKDEGAQWLSALYKRLLDHNQALINSAPLPLCILNAVRYIRAHLTQRLNAEQVAREVNMSRSYFSTSFKVATGCTFNDYLRHERVELAKQLLRKQKMTISQLAETVGYDDSKHFSRVFYAQTGVHCSEYARQYSPKTT
jgi:two-component system response regulator YesN